MVLKMGLEIGIQFAVIWQRRRVRTILEKRANPKACRGEEAWPG